MSPGGKKCQAAPGTNFLVTTVFASEPITSVTARSIAITTSQTNETRGATGVSQNSKSKVDSWFKKDYFVGSLASISIIILGVQNVAQPSSSARLEGGAFTSAKDVTERETVQMVVMRKIVRKVRRTSTTNIKQNTVGKNCSNQKTL
jgi:hypothetical protein